MELKYIFMIHMVLLPNFKIQVGADLPCVPRFYNSSSVCVCNNTYCDTVSREPLVSGVFNVYTSSRGGLRFSKTSGNVEDVDPSLDLGTVYGKVYELRPDRLYQTIEGFGGAVTDSAGMTWKTLPLMAQQYLINSYYSDEGLEYNMMRIPCGSTDFSTRNYTYNEYPRNDRALTNFTLAYEDKSYKIPMAKACKEVATDEIKIVSAVWSPPEWMKYIENSTDLSTIRKKHYQTYANYICKFVQLFQENGIDIWAMSTTNEPLIGISVGVKKEETRWTTPDMGEFIAKHFGPTMKNCTAVPVKILANDDMRFAIPLLFDTLENAHPKAYEYIDGIGVHSYFDDVTPPAVLSYTMKSHPTKFVLSTEACITKKDSSAVHLGSWENAKTYIFDILENLNYNVVGWIDWNMCLNPEGGPSWLKNFVDSPIIVDKDKEEFYKQPMFYALGHFSKFVPRGSRRMRVVRVTPALDPDLDIQDIEAMGQKYFDNVAFWTPRGSIVVIIHNEGPAQTAALLLCQKQMSVLLYGESITTVEIPYDGTTFGCI